MNEIDAETIFRSKNNYLAEQLRNLVVKSVEKANDMVDNAERPDEIYTAIKIAETAGKITGIVRDKQQINLQINQITGFTFIEANKPELIQEEELDIYEATPVIKD
jgi:hypothetical protein